MLFGGLVDLALLGLPGVRGDAAQTQVTPMEKVVEMLGELKRKVEEEGVTEAQMYKEFVQWCSDEQVQCKTTIATCEGKLTELHAQVEYEASQQERLKAEVGTVTAEISAKEAELQQATEVRQQEHQDFLAADAGFVEGINTFNSALEVLSKKPDETTLVQLANRLSATLQQQVSTSAPLAAVSPDKMQRFFEAVQGGGGGGGAAPGQQQQQQQQSGEEGDDTSLMQEDGQQQRQQPVYESRAGELIQMLTQMRGDIEDQRKAGMNEEEEKERAFELLKQSCELELKNLNAVLADKKSQISASEERQSAQEQEISTTSTLIADTQQHASDTEIACEEKAAENEERQKSRNEELGAIQEATSILTSDRAGEVNQRAPGAAPPAASFLQVASTLSRFATLRRHGLHSLSVEERLSRALGLLRPQVRARLLEEGSIADLLEHIEQQQEALSFLQQKGKADPFGKVSNMIQNMIQKLMAEAAEEAEHKEWCDKEQAEARKQGVHFERREEKLQSRIKETKAEVELHQGEIQRLSQTIQDMDTAAAEATKIRQEEKTAGEAALKDYADGQNMLQKAVQVLSDFYEKKAAQEGAASALLQRQKEAQRQTVLQEGREVAAQPKTFSDQGASNRAAAASGILNILEIALSDFARLQSETQTEESTAQREYDDYMQTYKVQKAVAEKEVENHKESQTKGEGLLQQQKKDLGEVQTELKAVYEYEEKLKQECDFSGPSYEERQARREQEIKSMQNALAILSGEAIA